VRKRMRTPSGELTEIMAIEQWNRVVSFMP